MKINVIAIQFITLLLFTTGCFSGSELTEMRVGGVSLDVEMADTPQLRQIGLQSRKNLPENQGMLFLFPYAETLSFWSKETYIPLSIAFIDDNGKIVQIEMLPPHQMEPVQSNMPVRYALEVNQGWFQKNGVQLGDFVKIKR